MVNPRGSGRQAKRQTPLLTSLQFVVIRHLRDGELSGRELRAALASSGMRKSGPVFYMMMSRLEKAGLVEGWYGPHQIGNQDVVERRYRATTEGREAWDATVDFFLAHSGRKDLVPV